jgi:hypothetical protein
VVEHQSDTGVFVVAVDGFVNGFGPFDHADPAADEPGLLDRHVGILARHRPGHESTDSCGGATSDERLHSAGRPGNQLAPRRPGASG